MPPAENNPNISAKPAPLAGWSIAALALLVMGLYLLQHPYYGLIHDARLYTLLALNHLHPDLFGNDIFLRHGSQGDFTLFSPLHGWVISLLGPEAAASLITLTTAAAFLVAAWWLARALMPAKLAWLAVGLLAVLPATYASGAIFTFLEGYVSPRQLAECLGLLAVAAQLRGKRLLAVALLLAGLLVHPIMSFPVAVLMVAMSPALQQWRKLWPMAPAAALLAVALLWGGFPLTRWQFDPQWLAVVGYGAYLKLANWSMADWVGVSNVLVTLGVAALCLAATGRRLAIGMLLATCALLPLSWLGCDLLHLVIMTQGQAWRVLWLASVIAILLLPGIAAVCWQGATLRRCGLLLLATAWTIGNKPLALCFSLPALLCIAGSGLNVREQFASLALRAVAVLFAVMLLAGLAVAWSDFTASAPQQPAADWIERLRDACSNGLLPGVVLLCGWFAATRIRAQAGLAALVLALLLPVAAIAASAIKPWTNTLYTRAARESLAGWRALIPQGTEVIWAADLVPRGEPMGAWLLLDRPSYFSSVQAATGLFSRTAALELQQRSHALPASLPIEYPYQIISNESAGQGPACRDIPAHFIVTQVVIPDARMFPAPAATPAPFNKLKLYICP